MWHDAAVPLGAFVAGVSALLFGEIARGIVGIVGDGFHELIVEVHGSIRCKGEAFLVERVLETHDTKTDWTVAAVRSLGSFGRVEVDIDDVVQCADGDGDGLLEHLVIE